MEVAPLFQAATRAPREAAPAGGWDCQFHLFGDLLRYPLRPARGYDPPVEATIEAAERMHRALGISHGVIVQSSAEEEPVGRRRLIDALAGRSNYRGVALIDDSVSERELASLHEGGVRGVRFNFVPWADAPREPRTFRRILDRIAELGWHVKIHTLADQWPALGDLLDQIRIPAVIDHMGHLPPDETRARDAEHVILRLLSRDNWWVMIANGDRSSAVGTVWDDVLPRARRLLMAAPDRTIWATDWPHVRYAKPAVPNDAELLELLYRIAPEAELRRKILVDNPARLLGFTGEGRAE